MSPPTHTEVHNLLHDMAQHFYSNGFGPYAFWTGVWAAEVHHTENDASAALSYLLESVPDAYDDVSHQAFDKLQCLLEFEMTAGFPTYEEVEWQMSFCTGESVEEQKASNQAPEESIKKLASSIQVYPNPNNGTFNVELGESDENTELSVWDLNGRSMLKMDNFTGGSLNLSHLEGGVYIVRCMKGSSSEQVRIAIIK